MSLKNNKKRPLRRKNIKKKTIKSRNKLQKYGTPKIFTLGADVNIINNVTRFVFTSLRKLKKVQSSLDSIYF